MCCYLSNELWMLHYFPIHVFLSEWWVVNALVLFHPCVVIWVLGCECLTIIPSMCCYLSFGLWILKYCPSHVLLSEFWVVNATVLSHPCVVIRVMSCECLSIVPSMCCYLSFGLWMLKYCPTHVLLSEFWVVNATVLSHPCAVIWVMGCECLSIVPSMCCYLSFVLWILKYCPIHVFLSEFWVVNA